MSTVLSRSFLPRLARSSFGSSRRHAHDGFVALNVYKDAAAAPKELVSPRVSSKFFIDTNAKHNTDHTTIPRLQDDAEYPQWLWRIQDPLPTKEELLREASGHFASGGYDQVFAEMPESDLKRLFKLESRDRIKAENERRRGGKVV